MKLFTKILEIALIFLLFALYGAYAVPDTNEAHYLGKAAHFWNPNYVQNDFFLDSPDAHGVFYWTFGWLTLFLPMNAVAWIGRILTWAGLACGWVWMVRPLFSRFGLAFLSAGLFLFLSQNCSFAGEWVVGGVEAKGFAFVLIFFALGAVIRNRWNTALILLGFAAMFHVLVGGWCLVALGIAWLILKDYERGLKKSGTPEDLEKCFVPTLFSILPGLILAGLLTLPALLPALQLNQNVSPEVAQNATKLYVYERLPHHLLLSSIAQKTPQKLLYFGILLLIWHQLIARPRYSNGEMAFRTFIYASLLIGLCGWGINLCMNAAPDLTASLLRYYWFRTVDVMIPLGAAILCVEYATHPVKISLKDYALKRGQTLTKESAEKSTEKPAETANGKSEETPVEKTARKLTKEEKKALRREKRSVERMMNRRRKMLVVLLLALVSFQIWESSKRFAKPMKPRSCSGAASGQSWIDLCQFIQENTEPTDVFVVPYTVRTFHWFARRPSIGVWKDVPQDSQGIWDWWIRMQDQFYGFDPSNPTQQYGRVASFTLMPKQKFQNLANKYGAKYLVRNKNDLKNRQVIQDVPNGIQDFELVYENKDFELRRLQ